MLFLASIHVLNIWFETSKGEDSLPPLESFCLRTSQRWGCQSSVSTCILKKKCYISNDMRIICFFSLVNIDISETSTSVCITIAKAPLFLYALRGQKVGGAAFGYTGHIDKLPHSLRSPFFSYPFSLYYVQSPDLVQQDRFNNLAHLDGNCPIMDFVC